MIVLNGKELSSKIKENIKNEVDKLSIKPKLAVISVGNDEASKVYVRNKEKACNLVGIDFELFHFDESTDEEIIRLIEELNFNDNISGILLQLPLPSNLNEELLINHISYSKDGKPALRIRIGEYHRLGEKWVQICRMTLMRSMKW